MAPQAGSMQFQRVAAGVTFGVSTVLMGIGLTAQTLGGETSVLAILLAVLPYAFAVVGLMIVWRRPENRIAWICLLIGLVLSFEVFGWGLAIYALANPGSLGDPAVFATIGDAVVMPGAFLVVTFLVLLFPDGNLPSPRWRPVAWFAGLLIVFGSQAGISSSTVSWGRPDITKPWFADFDFLDSSPVILLTVLVLMVGAVGGSLAALIVRYRGSRGAVRQQMKWFAFAACVALAYFVPAALLLTDLVGDNAGQLAGVILLALPVSIGIAVLRHGLFDIDRLISRTLTYTVTIATIGAAFAALTIWLPQLLDLPDDSPLLVAVVTLAAAALFNPWRKRVQSWVDRRFNRAHYDAQREVTAFTERLQGHVSPEMESLVNDTLRVVNSTVQPNGAVVWLRTHDKEA